MIYAQDLVNQGFGNISAVSLYTELYFIKELKSNIWPWLSCSHVQWKLLILFFCSAVSIISFDSLWNSLMVFGRRSEIFIQSLIHKVLHRKANYKKSSKSVTNGFHLMSQQTYAVSSGVLPGRPSRRFWTTQPN